MPPISRRHRRFRGRISTSFSRTLIMSLCRKPMDGVPRHRQHRRHRHMPKIFVYVATAAASAGSTTRAGGFPPPAPFPASGLGQAESAWLMSKPMQRMAEPLMVRADLTPPHLPSRTRMVNDPNRLCHRSQSQISPSMWLFNPQLALPHHPPGSPPPQTPRFSSSLTLAQLPHMNRSRPADPEESHTHRQSPRLPRPLVRGLAYERSHPLK
jgi:hypothetical protein